MSYYNTLNSNQKNNIAAIVKAANEAGIDNKYAIAGMLAIVSKESAFEPKNENMNYSAQRLQEVFGMSASRAAQLAGKPEAIANAVYGGRYGNAANEGWKYRGRGYNGLTFKANYKKYGDLIGVDLVNNPEKANDPDVAAKILIEYNKKNIEALRKNGKLAAYNSTGINDFKNTTDSTLAFYHATAGVGKSVSEVKALMTRDTLGGMTRALQRVNDLLFEGVESAVTFVKKKPLTTLILTVTLIVGGYILVKFLRDE